MPAPTTATTKISDTCRPSGPKGSSASRNLNLNNERRKPSFHDIIPQDLLPEISSHLSYELGSLKALSLVSKTWIAPAQQYIFASLTMRQPPSASASDIGTPPPAFSRTSSVDQKWEDLQHLIVTSKPHLASYITHLAVHENPGDLSTNRSVWLNNMCELLPKLVNLERFSLVRSRHPFSMSWPLGLSLHTDDLMHNMLKCISQLPKVDHVDLTRASLSWIQYLSPRVQNIALWDPYIDGQIPTGTETELHAAPSQHALPLAHVSPVGLLIDGLNWASCHEVGKATEWLLQAGLNTSRIRKLGLGLISSPHTTHEGVADLLRRCSPTLQELSLTPAFASYSPARDDYTDTIDFSILRSLRVLHLSVQAGIVQGEIDIEPMLWLLPKLENMPTSNKLETIIFSSEYTVFPTARDGFFFGIDFRSFGDLDRLLSTANRFPKFKSFVNYTEGAPSDKLLKWIAISSVPPMRRLHLKKKLNFKYGGAVRPTLFPAKQAWSL